MLLLSLPAHAQQRIVTLAPHLAELVCALGRCDALVGVIAWTDYPAQAAAKPVIGDAANLNLERLLAAKPDLVLAWRGGTRDDTVRRLQSLGLQVVWIDSGRLDDIGEAILDIGGWIGAEDRACELEQDYRQRLQSLREHYQRPVDADPWRVLYQIQMRPVFTVNAASPISEAIELCGGLNVFADLPAIAAPVGMESIIAQRPQLIVYGQHEDAATVRDYWARFDAIPAVEAQAFVRVDASLLTRQSPRILDGIEQLCVGMREQMPKD